ncbi:MAG: hypothetical protein OXH98_06620, partial [Caldilineaceae bacterium]|nr:hypothetical protein [Caldilineaceae bacterium]
MCGGVGRRRVDAKLEPRTHGGWPRLALTWQPGTRGHCGITPRSLTHQLATRTHGGIAQGGVAGGVPAQGTAVIRDS